MTASEQYPHGFFWKALASKRPFMRRIIQSLVPLLERTLTSRIGLSVHIEPNLPEVVLDMAMTESCVLNLILNARAAIQDTGTVCISLEKVEKGSANGQERRSPAGLTALIVEDTPAVAKVMARMLANVGLQAQIAYNIAEAKQILSDLGTIDFVISDIVMPGGSGLLLPSYIKSIQPHLPVILMSGYPQDEFETDLPSDVVYLRKPVGRDDLKQALIDLGVSERCPSGAVIGRRGHSVFEKIS
jgi:CheY-like chemotaxis protein